MDSANVNSMVQATEGLSQFIKETSREKQVLERELAEAGSHLPVCAKKMNHCSNGSALFRIHLISNRRLIEIRVHSAMCWEFQGREEGGFSKGTTPQKAYCVEPPSHEDAACAAESAFNSSLGFWFLLAQLSPHESKLKRRIITMQQSQWQMMVNPAWEQQQLLLYQ
eukprot:jgi/Picre1/32728/NNA_008073.t1